MIAAHRYADVLDGYCWACGAVDGEQDEVVGDHVRLCLCEPHDDRFPLELGVQWFCSACLIGRDMTLHPNVGPVKGWFSGARTPKWCLVAWAG